MVNKIRQAEYPMQTQDQLEVSNVMKNMFLRQVLKEPIVQIEVRVEILQDGLMEVVEEVREVLQNLPQAAVQEVLQVRLVAQAEAPEYQAVVRPLPQVDPHQENNLKNSL